MNPQQPHMNRRDRCAIYRSTDYASSGVRLGILLIDGVAIALFLLVVSGLTVAATPVSPASPIIIIISVGLQQLAAFTYVTLLKRSSIRTLGYRAFGFKVVALDGTQPSPWAMFTRTSLWFLLNPLINVMSFGQGQRGQFLSDLVAGTLVVRLESTPVCDVPLRCDLLFILRHTFLVRVPNVQHRVTLA